MNERTGYRDLIFNLWHRLIPHLKMIDLDFVQCCKHCSKPLLLCELTRQNKVKATKILRLVSEQSDVQGILINYYPRGAGDGFDKIHSEYLQQIYKLESEIKRLSIHRVKLINGMYRYCVERFGPQIAYDAMIKMIGFQRIYPDASDYKMYDSTYQFKVAMEHYRYCSEECAEADKNQPAPMPEILVPSRNGLLPMKKKIKFQLKLPLF